MGDSGYREAGDHPAAAAAVDPNAVYALGRSSGESDRLYRQADELRPESEALVERAGLGRVIARSTSAAGRVASSISSPSGSHPAGWWSGWHAAAALRADWWKSLAASIVGLANKATHELDARGTTHRRRDS